MIEENSYSATNIDARIQKFVGIKEKAKVVPATQSIEIEIDHKNLNQEGIRNPKSTTILEHVKDLKKCFDNLRKYNMKLNPEKCVFRVSTGKFLGFVVSERGIEANPDKIKEIMKMQISWIQRDIQKLAGSLVVLRQYIPKFAEPCLLFFELLKGAHNKKLVNWSLECNVAFEEVKKQLIVL